MRGKFEDITGKKYHRLLILRRVDNDRNGNTQYLCKCDCGKEVILLSGNIRHGYTKSCGCFGIESRKRAEGAANFNRVYRMYKFNAQYRKVEWNIPKNDFRKITQMDCHYCGQSPSSIMNDKGSNGSFIYNGIDRVDNSIGYIVSNCVPCCWECNRMKGDMSKLDFITHLQLIMKCQK